MSTFTALTISAATMLPSTPPSSISTTSISPSIFIPTPTSTLTPTLTPTTVTTTHPSLPTHLTHHNTKGNCAPQPAGHGPHPTPDTPYAFYDTPAIHSLASHAAIPTGYALAFSLAHASYSGRHYLGHVELDAYAPAACAAHCNAYGRELVPAGGAGRGSSVAEPEPDASPSPDDDDDDDSQPEQQCRGFNIYFERAPGIHLGPQCRTASSRTLIKCAIWGSELHGSGAVNRGYKEWDFEVVIAGSNGYHLERFGRGEGERERSVASRVGVGAGLVGVVVAVLYGVGVV